MTTGDNDGVCIGLGASLDSFKEVDEIAEKINNLLEIWTNMNLLLRDFDMFLTGIRQPYLLDPIWGLNEKVICYIHKLNHFGQNILILLINSIACVINDQET